MVSLLIYIISQKIINDSELNQTLLLTCTVRSTVGLRQRHVTGALSSASTVLLTSASGIL